MSWLITPQTKVPVDPQFGSVSLLLHGNGANGSTTITDSSPSPKAVTAVGNAQISTAQSKFGGSSLAFDGNGDAFSVSVASNTISSGNFAVETWVYVSSPSSSFIIFDCRNGDNDASGFAFYVRTTQKLTFGVGTGSSFAATEGASNIQANTWNHVALTRSGSTVRGFLNGAQELSVSNSNNFVRGTWILGNTFSISTGSSVGYIDELRITKGIARYTSNFTPPTAPFPDI